MEKFAEVLVASDFDDASLEALSCGRSLAGVYGARLHLLHVVDDASATMAAAFHPDTFDDLQAHVEQGAQHRLEGLLTRSDRERLRATAAVRVSRAVADTIVEYARIAQIDLIVVGTHGRKAVSRLFLGGVAERVVRTAACAVLVVRPETHEIVDHP